MVEKKTREHSMAGKTYKSIRMVRVLYGYKVIGLNLGEIY